MLHLRVLASAILTGALFGAAPEPAPVPSNAPLASPAPAIPTPAASPQPGPTAVPIGVDPPSAAVAVGGSALVHVSGVYGDIAVRVADPQLVGATVDQGARSVILAGRAPGSTTVTVSDSRGATHAFGVRIAYSAGTFADGAVVHITGDPAGAEFLRAVAASAAARAATARPGATIVAPPDGFAVPAVLAQDNLAVINVPVLVQGNDMFPAQGITRVRVYNDATPRISPTVLMVSDYPERLTENGVLFAAELHRDAPSRFLYFHYNPPGQPERRIVLHAHNASGQPAVVQLIGGEGGPDTNEMAAGHDSTERFLVRLVHNEGSLLTIAPNSTARIVQQSLPPSSVVSNIMQLRVLNGANVTVHLLAQNASDDPAAEATHEELLVSTVRHARGVYSIPDFKYERLWNTTDPYLELPIGQIPLPNLLQGEALSGDYGVLQSFAIKIQNPTSVPQAVALYENPRGGRATGTYLIDRVLVRSHGVPPFSRYKIRQYTVPAKGYVRATIVTMAEPGSSYPLRIIVAPDDGSVPPGAPGSPIY